MTNPNPQPMNQTPEGLFDTVQGLLIDAIKAEKVVTYPGKGPNGSVGMSIANDTVDGFVALIAEREVAARREAERERNQILLALAGMYEQYCPGRFGHHFMGAGEDAIEILENYGLADEENGVYGDRLATLSPTNDTPAEGKEEE